MANTTFQGVVRSYGGGGKGVVTPGVMVQSVQFACDPTATSAANVRIGTSATSGETLTLPAGAIVMSVQCVEAGTGGTNPTIDIGTSADTDGIFNALCVAGGLAANATVQAVKGASAATGGTFVGIMTYAMANDGVESN
jgi:hypothetical protein